VLRSTSLASKYIENVPAVTDPSDVALKRTMSESSTADAAHGRRIGERQQPLASRQ
jgi:hypothetical protein